MNRHLTRHLVLARSQHTMDDVQCCERRFCESPSARHIRRSRAASRRGSSSTPRGPLCPLLRGLSRRRPRNRSSTCSWVSEAVCRAAGLDPFFPNAWLIESTVQQHQTGLPAVGTIAKIPIADHWQASFPCAGNLIAGSYCRAYIRLWPPSRAFWNNRLRRKRQIYTRSSDVDRPSWRACVIDRYHPVSTFAPMCTRSSWG